MKLNNILSFVVAGALAIFGCAPVYAQRSFDTFFAARTLNLGVNTLNGASNSLTNGPIDIRMFDGISKIDIISDTNTPTTGGTLTVQFFTSTDTTNLVALSSYALGSALAINYTNRSYATSTQVGTNNWILPGTLITPSLPLAGFASQYLYPAQMTNSGSISIATPGVKSIGFNAGDALRYLYVVYSTGGSVTNFTAGAVMTGFVHDTLTH